MKHILPISILFLFISCNNVPNIEGVWYYSFESENNSNIDVPERIEIKNDSIYFNYSSFNHQEAFPIKVVNSSVRFKEYSINFHLDKDTLILGGFQKFTKTPIGIQKIELSANKTKIEVNLPQLNHDKFQTVTNFEHSAFLKYFGENPKTKAYSLLINDIYTNDFNDFLISHYSHHDTSIDHLFIDKSSKIIDLEKIFLASNFANQLKVVFINDINIHYNDSTGMHYNYSILKKSFSPNSYNKSYYKLIKDELQLPENIPPTPPQPPKINGADYPIARIIELRDNKTYVLNTEVNEEELIKIVELAIQKGNPILSLFDLESNYLKFLNLNAIIQTVFAKKRQQLSLKKFNKNFSDLNNDEISEIKSQVLMIHFWNYSIAHFNEIIKEDGSFYGFRVE